MIIPLFGQIPVPLPGKLEEWLVSAAAVMAMLVLGKKLFVRHPPLEAEFVPRGICLQLHSGISTEIATMKDRIDKQNQFLQEKLDQLKTDLNTAAERRASHLHERINELATAVARIDERTKES